jgi:acyl-CoA reductase-like NAD-dependent aldehyde dehydrogenase
MAAKRIYVHEDIYDTFVAAVANFIKSSIKMGMSNDPEAAIGPIQNSMQFGKLQGLYSQIDKQGWKAIPVAGSSFGNNNAGGYFLPPTLIDNPPEDSQIVVEEQFGPIVPMLKWSDEDDVVRRANATQMGLGASVWSGDQARAERTARRLEAGSVWVNDFVSVGPLAPYSGHKQSGIGAESGMEGLRGWCNIQTVWTAKSSSVNGK